MNMCGGYLPRDKYDLILGYLYKNEFRNSLLHRHAKLGVI